MRLLVLFLLVFQLSASERSMAEISPKNDNQEYEVNRDQLQTIYELGTSYLQVSLDSANVYANRLRCKSVFIGDTLYLGYANLLEAKVSYRKSEYNRTVNFIEEALKQLSDSLLVDRANCFNICGNAYIKMGNYKLALKSHLTCLKIRNQLGDEYFISKSLNNIGSVFFKLRDYNSAIDYYNKSLEIRIKQKDLTGIALLNNNIGNIYFEKGDRVNALIKYFNAFHTIDKEQNIYWKPLLLKNIGEVYQSKGEISKAIVFYQRALYEAREMDDQAAVATSWIHLGRAYLNEKRYNQSLGAIKKALSISKKYKIPELELEGDRCLSLFYEQRGDYQNSLRFQKEYSLLKDSLFRQNNRKEIAEMSAKYKLDKIEKENIYFKQKSKIQELEIEKQNTRNKYFSILSVLVLAVVIYTVRSTKQKKRHNVLLKEKNKTIYKQNKELGQLNATKDKFLSIVAHDLKNPFNAVLGFSDLLIDRYFDIEESTRMEYLEIIHKSAANGSVLLETLLTWSRSKMGIMTYNPIEFDLIDVASDELEILKDKALIKNIELEFKFNMSYCVKADIDMVRTVIRNLGNNAIKFTKEYGKVILSVSERSGLLYFSVRDNGIGIKFDDLSKLFKLDSNFTRPGTSNEKGTGLGLILCREFIEKNGGSIGVQSQEGVGSEFWFTLKINSSEILKKTSTRGAEVKSLSC
ncbi:tetratricopeptide repeat-containing sensor histidine kinase [Ancylomarina longa]|nr:tetratricopeptide repeat-containing sensor histidine kinase [Ancylomarina longa]